MASYKETLLENRNTTQGRKQGMAQINGEKQNAGWHYYHTDSLT